MRLTLDRADFPSNLDEPTIDQVVMYLAPIANEPVAPTKVTLRHASQGGQAQSSNGVISTRRGNAAAWEGLRSHPPMGEWELTFDPDAGPLFDDGLLADILLVIGYTGRPPKWPT